MYCKVRKWLDGKKWMCATVLWRNWSLTVNIWKILRNVAYIVVANYTIFEISTLSGWLLPIVQLQGMCLVKSQLIPADCCPYSSCRVFILWNLNPIQLIVDPYSSSSYVFCEISTLSSWLLPIWQLPGMHFMKSQLFLAECCPHGNCRVYNLWNLNSFLLIVAEYNISETSTLSSSFNRSVHFKQEHSS